MRAGHRLDAEDGRGLDDLAGHAGSWPTSSATPRMTPHDLVEVLVVGDGDVDDGVGAALGLVADPDDLAVADVPRHAVDVPQSGHPQGDLLDRADRLARVDDVTDAVLVLEDHEDAGEEVLDEALRAEAEGDAADARRGEERPEGDADERHESEDGDAVDDERDDGAQQRPEGRHPLDVALLARSGGVRQHPLSPVRLLTSLGLGRHGGDRPVDESVERPAHEEGERDRHDDAQAVAEDPVLDRGPREPLEDRGGVGRQSDDQGGHAFLRGFTGREVFLVLRLVGVPVFPGELSPARLAPARRGSGPRRPGSRRRGG